MLAVQLGGPTHPTIGDIKCNGHVSAIPIHRGLNMCIKWGAMHLVA